MNFEVNQTRDRDAEVARFQNSGRMQVAEFLSVDTAQAIHALAQQHKAWNAVYNRQGQHTDLDAAGLRNLSEQQLRAFLGYLNQSAGAEFQYYFANVPLYDLYHSGQITKALKPVYEFINSEVFLDKCRALTGIDDIQFADAQLTRYGPGQFLTRHDDDVDGKNRRAAYVLNLTPKWRTEWGGVLEFHDDLGNVVEGFTPAFNVLNVFKVPQSHSVSYVTPFARAYRYAITGWLRYGVDPKG